MARVGRPGMSRAQKRELWRRWKGGQSLSGIAKFFEKNPGSIFGVLAAQGGIAPRERRRSPRVLSLADREEISRRLAAGDSLRQIAIHIGRPTSTVSREVARHGGRENYRAAGADDAAWESARRPLSSDTQFHALRRHPDSRTPGRFEVQFRVLPSVASRSLSR